MPSPHSRRSKFNYPPCRRELVSDWINFTRAWVNIMPLNISNIRCGVVGGINQSRGINRKDLLFTLIGSQVAFNIGLKKCKKPKFAWLLFWRTENGRKCKQLSFTEIQTQLSQKPMSRFHSSTSECWHFFTCERSLHKSFNGYVPRPRNLIAQKAECQNWSCALLFVIILTIYCISFTKVSINNCQPSKE